jgi:hypothetical protein
MRKAIGVNRPYLAAAQEVRLSPPYPSKRVATRVALWPPKRKNGHFAVS